MGRPTDEDLLGVLDCLEAFKPHAKLGDLRVVELFAQPEEYSVN